MVDTDVRVADDLLSTVNHAWEAYHAADWSESHARWERVRRLFPGYSPPYIHGAFSLMQAGRLDEALAKLIEGVELFSDSPQLVTNIAMCLQRMGRDADARLWLENTIPLFPDNPEIIVDYILQSFGRADDAAVIRGADLMEEMQPGRLAADRDLKLLVAEARQRSLSKRDPRRLKRDARRKATPSVGPISTVTDYDLVMMFQSLGETCEFGLVQRHFQAEPLGLLRWTAIGIDYLTLGLNENFEAVGRREETRLVEIGTEYMTAITRYGMGSHTFIAVDKDHEEAIFKAHLARMTFLRRKLLEDLEAGDFIFVYTSEKVVAENAIADLHRAMVRHGSRYLLFVRKCSEASPAGTIQHAGNGLMLGYIDRLGPDHLPTGDFWNISFQIWIDMLKTANAMRWRDERIRKLVGDLRRGAAA
jgi:tetratricopeptide (TPR) repeat protein